jgi:hypothetical protein
MKRFRFTIATSLLATAVVALAIALVLSRLEVANLQGQLSNVVPIPELDIAVQVERQTAQAGIPVETTTITYNPIGSTYLVGFNYIHPKDGIPASGSVKLMHERDGTYVGHIRDTAFLRPVADNSGERGLRVTAIDRQIADAVRDARSAIQDGG